MSNFISTKAVKGIVIFALIMFLVNFPSLSNDDKTGTFIALPFLIVFALIIFFVFRKAK